MNYPIIIVIFLHTYTHLYVAICKYWFCLYHLIFRELSVTSKNNLHGSEIIEIGIYGIQIEQLYFYNISAINCLGLCSSSVLFLFAVTVAFFHENFNLARQAHKIFQALPGSKNMYLFNA